MKCVILAGGKGTRISEESQYKPKPLIEIGGVPIIVHIMRHYASYGLKEFILCLGHMGDQFVDYFDANRLHYNHWEITFAKTGEVSGTAERLRQCQQSLKYGSFCLTYGDGLCNVNIRDLMDTHRNHGKIGTVTAVQPPGRFGALDIGKDGIVDCFNEKPRGDAGWVSGGFFVFSPKIFDYLYSKPEDTVNIHSLEEQPLQRLAKDGQLYAHQHDGFWHPMDSMRDKEILEELWNTGAAPWK